MLIGGRRVDSASGQWFESFNPYTGKPWALIPRASPDDVNAAVAAARAAFKSKEWRGLTATARGKLLLKLADLIAAHADELGRIETTDNGKLILEMRAQTALLARVVPLFRGPRGQARGPRHPDRPPRLLQLHARGAARRDRRDRAVELAADARGVEDGARARGRQHVRLEAVRALLGVGARDGADLFADAGLPPGVVNIVTGFGNEIGDALVTHQDVAKIAFTGGDATGARVYQAAGEAASSP